MSLSEELASFRNLIVKNTTLLREGKGHLDHPEDLVFLQGSFGTERAIQAILDTVNNPKTITIKWDGYPALVWGYGPDNKFTIMDKHMFNKGTNSEARYIHSPDEFIQYDKNRGAVRPDLNYFMATYWNELQQLTPTQKGYYWGDLLFSRPLKEQQDGLYHFQANPKGIKYTVDPNSEIGKKYFKDKSACIAVHQSMPVTAETTDDAQSLNGTTGGMQQGQTLSILPSNMPITPKLKLDKTLYNKAVASVGKYGSELDNFFNQAPQSADAFSNHFTSFINFKIRSRNLSNLTDEFLKFMANSKTLSGSMRKKLLGYETVDPETDKEIHVPGYIDSNIETLKHIFQIWIDVYNFKMSVVPQLDKAAESAPVQGYLNTGAKSQEGFVSQGLKFINRMGFSAQNLQGR